MRTVFISGCYDILHAGHLQFFRDARKLGDHLTVCFASKEVLLAHKQRTPSIPDDHKQILIQSLDMVDAAVVGTGSRLGFDFEDHFRRLRPDVLAVTTDSHFKDEKAKLCRQLGAEFVVLAKTPPTFEAISSSQIVRNIRAPIEAPLRVDFAGGWLDVPKYSIPGEFIVNCAISPMVTLQQWDYKQKSGLGGSGAWAMLNGQNGVTSELALGVGWQDPAIIQETGCCVWRSGPRPDLDFKRNGDFLDGLMALEWSGQDHDTPGLVNRNRDYRMQPLQPAPTALAWKYCGGGYGGYALYLFASESDRNEWVTSDSNRRAIEPFCK